MLDSTMKLLSTGLPKRRVSPRPCLTSRGSMGQQCKKKKKTRSRPLTRRYLKIEAVKKLIFATKRHTRIRGHKQSNAMIARALA